MVFMARVFTAYAMRVIFYKDTFQIMSLRDNAFGRINEKKI